MKEKKFLTRSEMVRRRRRVRIQHQPRPPKKKVFGRRATRELPPITMRGVVNDYALERYRQAGRRRFNTTFISPHPRTRLLPFSRIHPGIGWRILSLFVIILFCTALYYLWSMPEFRITSAHVIGNQRISSDEINTMLGLTGQASFFLEPSEIEFQVLRDYPELKSIQVSVGIPNEVNVIVVERQPIIQWQQDGGYTWIDESGIAFRPHGEAQGLIPVDALNAPPPLADSASDRVSSSPFISEDTVRSLQLLNTFVPAGTPIIYDTDNGFSWVDPRGWQAVFGFGSEDMAVKVHVYHSLVSWLTQRGTQPALIDVTYPNAPYYRLVQGYAEE
jgi:cell division septal protein FtsQ